MFVCYLPQNCKKFAEKRFLILLAVCWLCWQAKNTTLHPAFCPSINWVNCRSVGKTVSFYFFIFLDSTTRYVGWSVGWSFGPSVGPSVCNTLLFCVVFGRFGSSGVILSHVFVVFGHFWLLIVFFGHF